MRAKPRSTIVPGESLDEIHRLYDDLVTSLYERHEAQRALEIADRLDAKLACFNSKAENIFIEECRSLVCEAREDLANAVKHREQEISLIRKAHELAEGTNDQQFVLSQYNYADLSERLDILAMLHRRGGNLKKAISTLEQSKQLCEAHGIRFDGDELLREYQGAKRSVAKLL